MSKGTSDTAAKGILTWRKTSLFGRDYELLAAEQIVARLQRRGFFNVTTQVLEAGEPVLEIRQRGIFTRSVHVKPFTYRFPTLADAETSWKGDTYFMLDDGRRFTLRVENFWQTIWQLYDEDDLPIARINRETWGNGGSITIFDAELKADELNLLLYLCWHIVVMKMEESAAAAAS